jgi:hypothetical protein
VIDEAIVDVGERTGRDANALLSVKRVGFRSDRFRATSFVRWLHSNARTLERLEPIRSRDENRVVGSHALGETSGKREVAAHLCVARIENLQKRMPAAVIVLPERFEHREQAPE